MNSHLTERQLIEYRFDLADANSQRRVAEHLRECPQCRKRLEQLDQKFASLRLLQGRISCPEELIAKTTRAAADTASAAASYRKRYIRVAATAAAVLLAAAILLLPFAPGREPKHPPIFAKRQAPARLAERLPLQPESESSLNDTFSKTGPAVAAAPAESTDRQPPALAEAKKPVSLRAKAGAAAEIEQQPPFAPASAIELVVLPTRENVQLTIYNSADLTLVRDRRNLTLKRGWNWLQFMWANTLIDPTSLHLEPLENTDKIDVRQLVFPAGLKDVGRWLIRSEVTGPVPFEITYFTSGINWRAFYMGTLAEDEKSMHLAGYVRVDNHSGENYENAQTRLLVGKVHLLDEIAQLARRQYPYGRPGPHLPEGYAFGLGGYGGRMGYGGGMGGYGLNERFRTEPKQIVKEGLSEYFLYTIEGTETIPDKWAKRLLSLQAEHIPVRSLYKYDEQRWGDQTIKFVSFANDAEHNLGDTPIPDGSVRIYGRADENGSLAYVGGTSIKYIPVGEEIELNLGPARLVKVEPLLFDFKTENYTFNDKGDISGWDEIENYKVTVTNTRPLPVELEITRAFDTTYWQLKPPTDRRVSYEKHDATHARFKLRLEPRSKAEFNYTVTSYHGRRWTARREDAT